jgi:hypothetical protein
VAGMLEGTIELCELHARPVDPVPPAVCPGVRESVQWEYHQADDGAVNPLAGVTVASQLVVADRLLLPSCLTPIRYASVIGRCYLCLLSLVWRKTLACKPPHYESKTMVAHKSKKLPVYSAFGIAREVCVDNHESNPLRLSLLARSISSLS